jgi:hypothetical protein
LPGLEIGTFRSAISRISFGLGTPARYDGG